MAGSAEAQLLEALRAGDEAAFAQLVREYQSSLVRVARIYVSTQAAAEEVAAETWLAVFNGLDRFEGRSSLKTWIFRILTNIAKTRAQRDGRTLPFSALQDPGREPEAAVDADRFLDPEHPRWPGHWARSQSPGRRTRWSPPRPGGRGRGDRGAAADAARRHLVARRRGLVAAKRSVTLSTSARPISGIAPPRPLEGAARAEPTWCSA